MNKLWKEMQWFLQQKIYVVAMILTGICSYGFGVVHPGLGIDDTVSDWYFADGLSVVVGRWVVYLINKVLHIAEYAPFFTDFLGVLLLMIAAVLMCVLFRRIFGDRVSVWGYVIFSCVFLSNPIISEVFVFYLHNGVGIGYIVTTLALLLFESSLNQHGKQKIKYMLGEMICLWIGVGCYESFLIFFLLGTIVIMFFRGMVGKDKLTSRYVFRNLGLLALIAIGCIVLRQITLALMVAIFQLQNITTADQRNLMEMFVLFQGRKGLDTLWMLVKRFWLVYHLNAVVYLPVAAYELAVFCFGIASVVLAIRRKNLWYPLLFVGMLIAPFLLVIAEASVTLYRACQYLPFFVGAGMLLVFCAASNSKRKKILQPLVLGLAFVLVFNQAEFMNRCFYVDYQKYENTKEVLLEVAHRVEEEYGTDTPVVFAGVYQTPREIIKDFYVDYSSWQFRYISAITDKIDVHLKEKYYSPYGYDFSGIAGYAYIDWGAVAFGGTNRELVHFLELHGHPLQTVQDQTVLEEARSKAESMPKWPAGGSVQMEDGYILIRM